jgi:hypothetical protein
MPQRRRRRNDELRHEVNDRIAGLAARMDDGAGESYEFLCECDRRDCRLIARLTIADYEELEAGNRRLIAPAHYESSIGTVEAVGPNVWAVAAK